MRTPRKEHLKTLARMGYGARGAVYLIIGVFALLAASGNGGGTTDSKGALTALLSQPFGNILLGLVAVGLVGYALWRFLQSLFDADGHGTDAKGLAVRAGLMVSAATHLGLAVWAFSILIGSGNESSKGSQGWTAELMQQPYGQWLVAAVGLAIIGAGIAHAWKAVDEKFKKYLQWDAQTARWATPVSKLGLIARGVVFGVIGGFLIVAALQTDPGEARGLGAALDSLRQQPYGTWLLGIVALGLAAFGVYSVIEAIYRRINMPDPTTG